jgi:glycosyltransferase involved in cell wall biosynthesis
MTLLVDRLERTALRSVDAVQVESAWMRDYVRRVTAGRPVLIRDVTPGVDATRFVPLSTRDLRAGPYVLCVGRFNDERKNVRLLLEAFALLTHERRSSTRLVLAGSAAPNPGFWQRAGELGLEERVNYVASPSPDELVRLYQSASVCALSSDEEGFGIVIIEAMSCAVPVVATRCGGPEGIIRDGCDGYLVGVGNVREMTDRLERLLSNGALNRRLGDAGRQAVLARFDRRVAGRALLETYEALLGGQCA